MHAVKAAIEKKKRKENIPTETIFLEYCNFRRFFEYSNASFHMKKFLRRILSKNYLSLVENCFRFFT